jgi:branched-chain amino acid transport system ATP-binding protein
MTTSPAIEQFRELFPPATSQAPPLDVTELGVRFGGLTALNGVTFTMNAHENMSVIGQNGAGKSTLLNAISGLVKSTPETRVTVNGRGISQSPAWQRAGAGLGRAFQDAPLVDQISCRENLLVGGYLARGGLTLDRVFRPGRARRAEGLLNARADTLLGLVGLTPKAEIPAGSLPYGARKLLDIARAMMAQPVVLLLDEPTSGLDHEEQAIVEDLLMLIRRSERLTVLMVEHHMNLVESVSDRVLVLEAGRLASLTTPADALHRPAAPTLVRAEADRPEGS